jgi:ATP-dependent HslUV protease subunit HslV
MHGGFPECGLYISNIADVWSIFQTASSHSIKLVAATPKDQTRQSDNRRLLCYSGWRKILSATFRIRAFQGTGGTHGLEMGAANHESRIYPSVCREQNTLPDYIQRPRRDQARSTTILSVRHEGKVAIGGDGQVTYGNSILKKDTQKLRRLLNDQIIVGFAGSTADAFALLERFEAKAKDYPGNLPRAATELARDWRTDRALRRLEAMMIVINPEHSLLITGQGDVVQPSDGVIGIGSGGDYAAAAARAMVKHTSLPASEIVKESLLIAAEIDVYTNTNIVIEEIAAHP